jgi:aldose 1-epimerase
MEFTAEISNGLAAKWISRGATLAELHVPDRNGRLDDVVLGFDDEAGYASGDNQHFGCTTGRCANRIREGRFSLDGVDYQLAINNGPNHLHGGPERGLDKVEWQGESLADGPGVRFTYSSPDGEESYPGNLDLTVIYRLTEENGVRIEYEATTDRPTIVNLTNHSYFNLAGQGVESVFDHELWIDADRYTPSDELLLPTGEVAEVAGTPLDFREARTIGSRIDELVKTSFGGYDHNFVLDGQVGTLRKIAQVRHPESGRVMTIETDQPAVQLYTGNGLYGQAGKQGKAYARHSAFCLETQHYPDAPNQPSFPSVVLRPGETYRHVCVYSFSAE